MTARTLTDVQAALAQVGIVAARWGAARRASLAPAESDLYEWLLRRFAAGEAPAPEALVGLGLGAGHGAARGPGTPGRPGPRAG